MMSRELRVELSVIAQCAGEVSALPASSGMHIVRKSADIELASAAPDADYAAAGFMAKVAAASAELTQLVQATGAAIRQTGSYIEVAERKTATKIARF